MHLLSVQNICTTPALNNFALNNISFTQEPFQNLAIIGETGSGKSTLLKTIAGFIQHSSGTILLENKIVKGPNWQLILGQEGIAYLSQHFELRHNYVIKDLLDYANKLSSNEAQEIYEICKINHLLERNSKTISGGEKQRIALAKLLVTKPRLLILDEPFSNLDLQNKKIIKQVIADACTRFKTTCILSSHDHADTLAWADKILVLHDGKIIQDGTANEIYKHPQNAYVAGLLDNFVFVNENVAFELNIDYKLYKNKYLRPNNFKIKTKNGTKAIVTNCNYLGAFYEIELTINSIKIYTNSLVEYKIGDEVFVEVVI
jgi:ABC-type sugar transport system ATPase subunit